MSCARAALFTWIISQGGVAGHVRGVAVPAEARVVHQDIEAVPGFHDAS